MSVGPGVPVRPGPPSNPLSPPPRRRGPRRAKSFTAALWLTVLNAVLPGSAFLATGRRWLGAITLTGFLAVVGGALWLATGGQRFAARIAVDTTMLLGVLGVVVAGGVVWVAVILAGYRMLVPRPTSAPRHAFGALVCTLLVLVVAVPAYYAGRLSLVQRDLIGGVFTGGESATVVDKPNPFGDKARVNVLLLGGDGGVGREGVRTDTVIVASIDTHTGDTVLFSLPRNLENLPFPPDSPLARVYPDGFQGDSESEGLLNAVYRNGPAAHPKILGPTDHPGADFLKLGVGEALGLTIDYFVLVNLDGFSRMVDALGGITVNVNYWVPVGGEPSLGQLPDDYISPGPAKHMDGPTALAFARGRFGLTDYDRMDRQRCVIHSIIAAADPVTLLGQYQELAATTKDIVETDIPPSALSDFVDLGFLVKDASVRSVVFDDSVINPAYPDYDRMRRLVEQTLAPRPRPSDGSAPAASSPAPSSSAASSSAATSSATVTPTRATATDVTDACAYDPEKAAEALAAGKPPTKNG
jgi:polyisoprenyl-teichoic acid--peptidoglycan teichoic acid transferase